MFEELFPEKGVARRSYSDLNIVIICKQDEEGVRKAIFIPRRGLLFFYLDRTETVEEKFSLVVGGYDGTFTDTLAAFDLSSFQPFPPYIQFDITEFLDNEAYMTISETIGLYPAVAPPLGQTLLTFDGKEVVSVPEDINYDLVPFPYSAVTRGTDRDIAYNVDTADFGEYGTAAIYQRLRDVDFKWTFVSELPNLQTGTIPPHQMVWPSMGFDNQRWGPYYRTVGNKIYIKGWIEGTLGALYAEYWLLDLDALTFSYLYSFNSLTGGGASERVLRFFVLDYIGTKMGFTAVETYDFDGNISDKEMVFVREEGEAWYPAMDTPLFSFNSGDYFGYAERTSIGRETRAWFVGDASADVKDIYAVLVSNFTSTHPDGILARYIDADDAEQFEVVYQAPDGYWLRNITVDPFQPELFIVGQQSYTDSNDKRILLINVKTKKVLTVTNTSSDLGSQATFVR